MIKEFNHPEKPFEVNDRVKHKLFGEGFVEKLKLATNYRHYYVHVVFDEEHQVRPSAASTRYRYLAPNYLEKITGTQPINIPALDALNPID